MTQSILTLSISEQFKLAFSRFPQKTAIKSGARSYTFQELDHISARLGKYLFESLGETELPVAIFLQDPIDIVTAIIAAMRSGYSYSVLSEKNPPVRLKAMLVDLDAKILITDPALFSAVREFASADCQTVNIFDLPKDNSENFYHQDPSNDSVGIYYTSGSTGEPKGVMRLHTAIVARALFEIGFEKFTPEDTHCITPSFSGTASLNFFMPFFSGATFVAYEIDKYGFSELKRVLLDEKITVFRCSVQPFRHFLSTLSDDDFFPDLRLFIPTGDALYRSDVEILRKHVPPDVVIIDGLSSSEIGHMTRSVIRIDTPLNSNKLPAGFPWATKEILLIDENGIQVPSGETGEILVRSGEPFHGYWRKPELSAEKLIPDPSDPSRLIYRSGDLGRFHPDGQLEHIGRKDFRVKIRGFNVDLSAIENVLMSDKDVQRAIVVAAVDKANQKRLVGYVLPMKGARPIVKSLMSLVSANLPSYMLPALIIIVDELPLGITGKVDRAKLPAPEWNQIKSSAPFVQARNTNELRLFYIWKNILGLQQVGINDNFFDLGGDSLLAMQLLFEIEKNFSRKLPLSIITKASTIKEQAEILDNQAVLNAAPVLVPLREKANSKALYCVAAGADYALGYQALLKHLPEDQSIYALRSRGFEPGETIDKSIEEIAKYNLLEIKRAGHKGPFYILGFSFGGVVAYEMAQQLQHEGQKVELVVILDTVIQHLKGTKKTPHRTPFTRIQAHAQILSQDGLVSYLKHFFTLLKVKITNWQKKIQDQRMISKNKRLYNILKEMKKLNSVAYRAYQLKPYSGRVVFIGTTKRQEDKDIRLDRGWSEVGIKELIVYPIGCSHLKMLKEPFVEEVARITNLHINMD